MSTRLDTFEWLKDFVEGEFVGVRVRDGVATVTDSLTPEERRECEHYIRHHCRRAQIPLTDVKFRPQVLQFQP